MGRTVRAGRAAIAAMGIIALAVVLTACPATPPPPLHPPPTIVSAEVVESPVTAGGPVTVRVVASHPAGISRVRLGNFLGPANARLPVSPVEVGSCGGPWTSWPAEFEVVPEPGVATEITVSCVLPATAPNGSWRATIDVIPPGYAHASVTVPFEVVGGTDDTTPPKLTVVTGPPASIIPGSSFPLVFRVEDANLGPDSKITGLSFYLPTFGSSYSFYCLDPVAISVSPTVEETTVTCTTTGGQGWGRYVDQIELTDAYGRTSITGLEAWVAFV